MYFMDMHCHILPGVDDGSRDEAMSMEMIGIAYSQGVRKIVLTPHYYVGKTKKTASDLKAIFDKFEPMVKKDYPEIDLYMGNEIYWGRGAVEGLKEGIINTYGDSKYVLVEFSPRCSYNEVYGAVRELVQHRFRPIIAHMERYQCLNKHIERVEEIIENGAYLQMNVDSLIGSLFDGHTKWCRKLVLEGYISLLGTDAHNIDDRAPYIEQTVSWLKKKLDEDSFEALMHGNGEAILENKWLD